ncbi:hypothetical protein NQ318_016133 [Aromia moschata]|uniref:Beta-1,3-glucan-binding protein n=1 Tax=Aromia moschata TaxID=1265417 RepID=A0AAV8Y1C3_9CUCU|nr:hypothetical protein NQ318_016133 [Aromia moschata]
MWRLLLLCAFARAQYEVPDALVEAYTPRGFSVSIPDEEGIKLFAFHGKINEEMDGREAGTFSRDILKPKNGRWTFSDSSTKLKAGDIIYYWTYVEYAADGKNKLGYPNDDQMFVVKELVERSTSPTTSRATAPPVVTTSKPVTQTSPQGGGCQSTETRFTGGRTTCQGKLIFNENFNVGLREKFWNLEQRFAGSPVLRRSEDYEFVIYMNRSETLLVERNKLTLKPILLEDIYGKGHVTQSFSLGESCTGVLGSPECGIKPDAGFILPPVLSSRINSKKKFSFKYGKIEIRAKFPKGNWIYPELYLNSDNDDYGLDYDSGQIRIAYAPGNEDLSKILEGGVILGSSIAARKYGIKTIEKHTSWANEYHRFGVIWKPDSITVTVDDKVYGAIYPPSGGFGSLGPNLQVLNAERWKGGTSLTPFDKEMYVTLGVGVGGFNFEDKSDGSKPWKNGARSSVKDFYKAQPEWSSTWNEDSKLEIDYVRVWAL